MFCSNCGAKNNNNAKFCTSCGKKIGTVVVHDQEKTIVVENTKKYSSFDISSLILGILGILYSFSLLFNTSSYNIFNYLDKYYFDSYFVGMLVGLIFSIVVQLIFAILSLVFSLKGKSINKNGMNEASLVISIIVFALFALRIFRFFL